MEWIRAISGLIGCGCLYPMAPDGRILIPPIEGDPIPVKPEVEEVRIEEALLDLEAIMSTPREHWDTTLWKDTVVRMISQLPVTHREVPTQRVLVALIAWCQGNQSSLSHEVEQLIASLGGEVAGEIHKMCREVPAAGLGDPHAQNQLRMYTNIVEDVVQVLKPKEEGVKESQRIMVGLLEKITQEYQLYRTSTHLHEEFLCLRELLIPLPTFSQKKLLLLFILSLQPSLLPYDAQQRATLYP